MKYIYSHVWVTSLSGAKVLYVNALTQVSARLAPFFDKVTSIFVSVHAMMTPLTNKTIPGESKRSTSGAETCCSRKTNSVK